MWSAALFTIPLHCLLLHFQFRTDPSSLSHSLSLSFSLRLFLPCHPSASISPRLMGFVMCIAPPSLVLFLYFYPHCVWDGKGVEGQV